MKRKHRLIPLFAAALPLTAAAAPENLDSWQGGRNDPASTWLITQLLGDDVIAGENTEVGEVADVVLDSQGQIQSLIVYSNGNQAERGFRKVSWPVQVFEPRDVQLSIAQQPSAFGEMQHSDSPEGMIGSNQFSASSMLGMGVQAGGSPYAEVEDLVVNDQGQITSAVIDPDGLDTVDYWIPTDMGWVSPEWVLVLPYSQNEIEQTEPYRDNGTSS